MKKFFVYVTCVSMFFVLLGAMVDSVGAKFKSDAKALEIIAKARQAVGGDAALAEVRSLIIKGQTTHTMKIEGVDKIEQGQTEIVMQLPDKLMKKITIGEGEMGEASAMKSHDVMIFRKGDGAIAEGRDGEFTTSDGKKIVIRKVEGGNAEFKSENDKTFTVTVDATGAKGGENVEEITTTDGKKVIVRKIEGAGHGENVIHDGKEMKFKRVAGGEAHEGMRQNELLRYTLSLLLSAPGGMDVSYTFVGEGNVEGVSVNTVDASFAGATFRMHFDKGTNLPVALVYTRHKMPNIIFRTTKDGAPAEAVSKEMKVFTHKIDGPGEMAEHLVRFADYRSVNGVQLPYKWTTSVAGQTTEVFDVTSFEVNPANIAERFDGQKIFVRTAKPVQN
jgi:hypothetical protein